MCSTHYLQYLKHKRVSTRKPPGKSHGADTSEITRLLAW